MTFTVWHWTLVLLVFFLLFGGRGRISELVRHPRLDPLMLVALLLLLVLAIAAITVSS
jgi:hypothetical protein